MRSLTKNPLNRLHWRMDPVHGALLTAVMVLVLATLLMSMATAAFAAEPKL